MISSPYLISSETNRSLLFFPVEPEPELPPEFGSAEAGDRPERCRELPRRRPCRRGWTQPEAATPMEVRKKLRAGGGGRLPALEKKKNPRNRGMAGAAADRRR
jgi:hypothetical protein